MTTESITIDSFTSKINDAVIAAIKNNIPQTSKSNSIWWFIGILIALLIILSIIIAILVYIQQFFNSTDNCFKVPVCSSTLPASSAFRTRQFAGINTHKDDSIYYDKIANFLNNQKYINYVEYKNFLEYNNITNEKLYDTKLYTKLYELRPNIDKTIIQKSIILL